jgi:hypothetical protein
MESLANTKGSIPHIFLITDGTTEDERDICANMRTQIANSKPISPRISTFGIGNVHMSIYVSLNLMYLNL